MHHPPKTLKNPAAAALNVGKIFQNSKIYKFR
jgi:hypothetical protein